jgi:hypothetical protein
MPPPPQVVAPVVPEAASVRLREKPTVSGADAQMVVLEPGQGAAVLSLELRKGPQGFGFVIFPTPLSIPGPRLFVKSVKPNGPAAVAGLQPFDQLLDVDGKNVRKATQADAISHLRACPANAVVPLLVARDPLTAQALAKTLELAGDAAFLSVEGVAPSVLAETVATAPLPADIPSTVNQSVPRSANSANRRAAWVNDDSNAEVRSTAPVPDFTRMMQPQSRRDAHVAGSVCSQCLVQVAELFCETCDRIFCATCAERTHGSNSAWRDHRLSSLNVTTSFFSELPLPLSFDDGTFPPQPLGGEDEEHFAFGKTLSGEDMSADYFPFLPPPILPPPETWTANTIDEEHRTALQLMSSEADGVWKGVVMVCVQNPEGDMETKSLPATTQSTVADVLVRLF